MKLIAFTKMFQNATAEDLRSIARRDGLDGFDLCVREGYPVNPDNIDRALPDLVRQLGDSGVSVPMITGPGLWCDADAPQSRRIVRAMADAGVRLFKLGYMLHKPAGPGDYRRTVERFREGLTDWAKIAGDHGVRVCYHTHCDMPGFHLGYHLGTNCAELMHLIEGFDPTTVGAYIGTGNLVASGEPFTLGLEMLRDYLAVVELQDLRLEWHRVDDEGDHDRKWTTAGSGAVHWTQVFSSLARVGFEGPMTMHAEFEVPAGETFDSVFQREAAYFRAKRDVALTASP